MGDCLRSKQFGAFAEITFVIPDLIRNPGLHGRQAAMAPGRADGLTSSINSDKMLIKPPLLVEEAGYEMIRAHFPQYRFFFGAMAFGVKTTRMETAA